MSRAKYTKAFAEKKINGNMLLGKTVLIFIFEYLKLSI